MDATEGVEAHVAVEDEALGTTLAAGAVGGLAAGILMGLIMHFEMEVMVVVSGLYRLESVTAGWVIHLVHAVLFGMVFSLALDSRPFRKYQFGPLAVTSLGVAWGVALWMVAAGVIMPLWMDAAGLVGPPLPNWAETSGIGHLVYGLGLGAAVAATWRR